MDRRLPYIEYSQPYGVTHEANTLTINYSNAWASYIGNSIFLSQKIEKQKFKHFLTLKNKWKEEIMFVSSGSMIISNSAYIEIMNLGPAAIPWIIRELKKTDDHWFYALEKLTGVNPIKGENKGIIEEMRKDWLAWASKNNYL